MAGEGGNQRVTNAILGVKLDRVAEDIKEIKSDVAALRDDHGERLRKVETCQAAIKTRVNVQDGLLGIFQVIGTAIGAMMGPKA